jgi:hypothetical protein
VCYIKTFSNSGLMGCSACDRLRAILWRCGAGSSLDVVFAHQGCVELASGMATTGSGHMFSLAWSMSRRRRSTATRTKMDGASSSGANGPGASASVSGASIIGGSAMNGANASGKSTVNASMNGATIITIMTVTATGASPGTA